MKQSRRDVSALLEVLGARNEALREIEELLEMEPHNRRFQAFKASLVEDYPFLTYPQHYDEETRREPGEKHNLKLFDSAVIDFGYYPFLRLVYQWDATFSDKEANRLALRAIAYISCAIYDAATTAGLVCRVSEIPNGRRPAWYIEGESLPISLAISDIDISERTCEMNIHAVVMALHALPRSRTHLDKLHTGFKARFSNIIV